MRYLIVMLSGLALGCSQAVPDRPVSPGEVRRNIQFWDGKNVVVVGWLGHCDGKSGPLSSCFVFESKADIKASVWRGEETKAFASAWESALSLGGTREIDKAAEL